MVISHFVNVSLEILIYFLVSIICLFIGRKVLDLITPYDLDKQNSDADWALRNINLDWQNVVAYALLGPSGCGKTTLLNIISGLLNPTKGKVLFDNKDITAQTPVERNIAQIFQFPVIYDTMTFHNNLAFPLKNR